MTTIIIHATMKGVVVIIQLVDAVVHDMDAAMI
jgi:hypothetical protein